MNAFPTQAIYVHPWTFWVSCLLLVVTKTWYQICESEPNWELHTSFPHQTVHCLGHRLPWCNSSDPKDAWSQTVCFLVHPSEPKHNPPIFQSAPTKLIHLHIVNIYLLPQQGNGSPQNDSILPAWCRPCLPQLRIQSPGVHTNQHPPTLLVGLCSQAEQLPLRQCCCSVTI